jgi:gamma-glutamyltranspeptidase/glutathione hydrolase
MRLGIMDQFGFGPGDHNTSAYTHAFVEGSRGASSTFREDPTADLSSVESGTLGLLLSEAYWRERAAEVDFSRATPRDSTPRGDSAADCSPTGYTPTGTAPVEAADTRQHTTHFTVADREGNVVSSTQTLGNVFGSKVMPRGTGIWLNDSVAWSRFEPEGNVFDVAAGGQSYYALAPTIVLEDGRPRAALGTPGGRTIPQTTAQMVMNLVDSEMDVQRAVSEPRFASFWSSGSLAVEPGFPEAARQELAALGHEVYVEESGIGDAQAVGVEYGEDGRPVRLTGGADPRGEGLAAGF